MNTPDYKAVADEMRVNLRRHDLRENERLVAEALVDSSFALKVTSARLRRLDVLTALTGIRLDRVKGALDELRKMNIVADVCQDDEGLTIWLQPDAILWKCRVRVDPFTAAVITRGLEAEARRNPAQLDLIPAESNLSRELAMVKVGGSGVGKNGVMECWSNGDGGKAVRTSVPKNGSGASTLEESVRVRKLSSIGQLPKNRNGAEGEICPRNARNDTKDSGRTHRGDAEGAERGTDDNHEMHGMHENTGTRTGAKNGIQLQNSKTPSLHSPITPSLHHSVPEDDPNRWITGAYVAAAVEGNQRRGEDYIDPASLDEHDLFERLRRVFGDAQIDEYGGAWRRKCQRWPRLIRMGLNEIATRTDIRDPLHFLIDLMKRGPRDYAALCKTETKSTQPKAT